MSHDHRHHHVNNYNRAFAIAISLGVVLAGVAILLTGWLWLDHVLSLLIVIVILIGSWNLLKESLILSVDAVPEGTDIQGIKNYLNKIDNVTEFHDLHV
ncbi:MAG: cation transporter [Gammaproteobacteria bacterium]|jgi:cobalt-zinc-cadmium efflux system protein|nr:cation transporter [Gammaproteobacteria bacterium]MBT3722410.1 cation transporter [Gammaproteobacteria bacterium]MBT4075280.1 cation transporter [Gammaproteobacteria bacterium]MBT4196218.1 cation transporter [Gammaproteobacteria bacterium]MBT4861222.1 cation transporter [Gammaproteobacteria bacterium]